MPVSVAAGVEVVFDDKEPPGVDGAAAVVGVDVAALAVVVVVLVPADPAAVVVVVAPPTEVVVVVPVPLVVVVVLLLDPEASVFLFDDFLEAEGVDEPQAAAISPAATTTPAIRSELRRGRRARPGVDAMDSLVLGTVVRPRSFGLRPAGPGTTRFRLAPASVPLECGRLILDQKRQ
jgi:hypothetical protein